MMMSTESQATTTEKSRPATASEIESVYRARFRDFARVAAAIGGDREAAPDIVHDAFTAALRSADAFRGEGTLEAWLWRAVVNTSRNHRRRRRIRSALRIPLQPDPAGAETRRDPHLRMLVARLPDRQRTMLFLRYYADLDYATIATAVGVHIGTVSATLNQAHAALRRALEEQ